MSIYIAGFWRVFHGPKRLYFCREQPEEESLGNFSNGTHLMRPSESRRGTATRSQYLLLIIHILAIILCVIGTMANGSLLALLVYARRKFGNNVSSFIANQSAMDLFACLSRLITVALDMTNAYMYIIGI